MLLYAADARTPTVAEDHPAISSLRLDQESRIHASAAGCISGKVIQSETILL
jgi:hypothetical protein